MPELQASQVFTPGAFPSYTYVERSEKGYEARLRDALETQGQVISLSGPSKSGKTVLVERVVGLDSLIPITGAGIEHPDELWSRALDWMGAPSETVSSRTLEGHVSVGAEATGQMSLPLFGKAGATGKTELSGGGSAGSTRSFARRGLTQVVAEIGGSDFVILIDDFHYMPRSVQEEVAKQIKEAVRQGVKIVTASVSHRSDDVVRANPELRGRVTAVDLDYWNIADLSAIAERGFNSLEANLQPSTYERFAIEAAGSPQLMQAICLNSCFELDIRAKRAKYVTLFPSDEVQRTIFQRTAAATDFRSLVDVLDSGPKTRGTERKTYKFKDATEGDVYRCILKAIASDPPKLAFPYDEILGRVNAICIDDEPVGSSVTGTCVHVARLALDKFPAERVIDWDEQKQILDIPDPYLLFYLRWSGRLLEAER